ncbi:MAG TPA: Rne/Rng family ribonuclease [Stellaceae bacterium]|nr:Rne/Rng family ribonuclease [Stellaceae bacterium]
MTKRMLIDAAHPEETRVVVLSGNRLDEFDYETSTKKQIKGNIYLARVTRVEPSLQAAFVEYGGNRHGFLAFNEIHPDYYRIPVADREAALEAARDAEAAENEREDVHEQAGLEGPPPAEHPMPLDMPAEEISSAPLDAAESLPQGEMGDSNQLDASAEGTDDDGLSADDSSHGTEAPSEEPGVMPDEAAAPASGEDASAPAPSAVPAGSVGRGIETVGGDEMEETRRPTRRPFRHYKIQEVIKRRQIMLVQVTKEERGNKGAALTTYLSLAGRYCVLMPNTPRGGGVSRKITSSTDRRRLKDLMSDLEVPEGMGVIVRTAGSERTKPEIKRDFEYLRRLWDEIRELTLKSTAPALIYEEGSLIKRSIRDLYSRDIEEVVIDGVDAYNQARSFMTMLMPSHTKRVKLYRDPTVPLFHRHQIESQLDAIHSPVVQLKSGGYAVFNPTEALVAIDVNSGRSTRERNIEETAYKTNLEASDEIARQLRLRDLAGLIVIDFIDMEEHRNQHAVERRLKEAMRHDRARIQLGRISPFGLLEMSRQRLRPSLIEASTQPCPHCQGSGNIRSTESTALHVLRAIEEEGVRRRSAEIVVAVPTPVALYILNQKRATLQQAEARYGFRVTITRDDTLIPPAFKLERVRALTPAEIAALPVAPMPTPELEDEDDVIVDDEEAPLDGAAPAPADFAEPDEGARPPRGYQPHAEQGGEGQDGPGRGRGRRRRRRGRHGGDGRQDQPPHGAPQPYAAAPGDQPYVPNAGEQPFAAPPEGAALVYETVAGEPHPANGEPQAGGRPNPDGPRRRRRGRRGGRRRRRGGEGGAPHAEGGPGTTNEAGGNWASAPPESDPAARADMPLRRPEPAEAAVQTPHEPPSAAPSWSREPEPAAPAPQSAPPASDTVEPPGNPKRGWWRR